MAVTPNRPGRTAGTALDPRLRAAIWAAMAAAVFWTLVYRRAEQASKVPEFVYVNF